MTAKTESGPAGSAETEDFLPDLDAEYRQMREACGLLPETSRAMFKVSGPDAAEFLQGQITNETEDLETGSGHYAALLDRKGHIQTDLRLLRIGKEEFWLDAGAESAHRAVSHLTTYKIGRKVEVTESDRRLVSLIGPGTAEVTGVAPGGEHDFSEVTLAGSPCLAVATDLGQDILCGPEVVEATVEELTGRGAVVVSPEAAEIVRVESGRPRFGQDMTEASMPAEAGIIERAVDFTKGCYIGQEPVARLHYRGRPNRHLRGLQLEGQADHGDTVRSSDRDLGTIGSTVISPAFGQIGLAILRKEAEPGDRVIVVTSGGEIGAEVIELPFARGNSG